MGNLAAMRPISSRRLNSQGEVAQISSATTEKRMENQTNFATPRSAEKFRGKIRFYYEPCGHCDTTAFHNRQCLTNCNYPSNIFKLITAILAQELPSCFPPKDPAVAANGRFFRKLNPG
jgi:hypothetical protein